MQRLLFAKVEVWLVAMLALFGVCAAVLFGALVLTAAQDTGRLSPLRQAAMLVAEVPETLKDMLGPDNRIVAPDYAGFRTMTPGWNVPPGGRMPELPGYLLLSRYDGNRTRQVIELVSMKTWDILHSWSPDADALLADVPRTSEFIHPNSWNTRYFRALHPLLTDNGDLIIKDHATPLFRIDGCSKRLWKLDTQMFHHSTEPSDDGTFWVGSRAEPQQVDGVNPHFYDDEIAQVSMDGKLLFKRSVPQLLIDHGLSYLMFTNGAYVDDPVHLNDIQPVLKDGPYWKRGDLFLSLRDLSAIMLYRPSTDEIVWMRQGPWIAQHDVDILDDHRISVYDNHAEDRGNGAVVRTNSDIKIYDFATDAVTDFLNDGMAKAGIRTLFAGLFTALPGGYSLVEDVTNARLVIFAPDGTLAAQYANKADNGKVYHLGWNRYIEQPLGDSALAALGSRACAP